MRAYLAGPMSGIQQYNFPAFDSWRDKLVKAGYEVVSPADIDRAHGFDAITGVGRLPSPRDCALRDIAALFVCDMIFLMPGWEASKGACMERAIAEFLSLPVVDLTDDPLRPLLRKFSDRCNCKLCQEQELP